MKFKKRILIISGSRADYGLLKSVILKCKQSEFLNVNFAVTGGHLCKFGGMTVNEIREDKIRIDYQVDLDIHLDDPIEIPNYLSKAIVGFSKVLADSKPQLILVLGDRYEIFGAACASLFMKIPVVHIHGGELSQGSYDDNLRHCITKLSHLHLVSADKYRSRVIQLGEDPNTVYNVGSLGVENILNLKLKDKFELEKLLNGKFLKKNLLVTFHPTTLTESTSCKQLVEVLKTLRKLPETRLIFTAPGIDCHFRKYIRHIQEFVAEDMYSRTFIPSLGQLNYFSLAKNVDAVVGNSSSGLIEIPSLNVPTINLGFRQDGRERSESVIDCGVNEDSILSGIKKSFSSAFRKKITNAKNVHDKLGTSDNIVRILEKYQADNTIKNFKDIKL